MTSERQNLVPSPQQLVPLEDGFTLIELLIVMSIILIIMAFAVPSFLKLKKNTSQTSAVQTMKVLASAEMSYNSTYPNVGYGCPITVLGGDPKAGAPSAQAAQLIDATLASTGIHSGYVFNITCGNKTTANNQDVYGSFEITGVPQSVGHSGDNGYCTDDTNTIKVDPTGGTNCTQPLQ